MNWQDQWHNFSKGGYPICDVKTIDCDDGKLLSVVFWLVDQTTGFQEHAVYLCEPGGKCRYERQGNFDLVRATPPAEPAGNAPCDVQAVFLNSLADEIELRTICPKPFGRSSERPSQSWGDSCRMIADEMTPVVRDRVAGYLEILIEHLREVRECSACEGTGRVPDDSGNFPDRPGITAGPFQEWSECPVCNGTKVS